MSPDTSPESRRAPKAPRRRRRSALAVLAVAGLVLLGAVPMLQTSVDAAPPRCEDGSPPPCDVPDPDPTTTSTTGPRPVVWTARVSVLDQSGGFNRTMWGGWLRAGSPVYSTPAGYVGWTDSPANTEGSLGLTQTYLPPGGTVGFYMNELGTDGPVCRSQPVSAVPPTGRNVHVLLAPAITKSPADVSAMVAGFTGRVTPDPDGAEVTINTVSLVPQQNGLLLTVSGRVYKDVTGPFNYYGNFTYVVMLRLNASRRIDDPYEVMTVSADQGVLQLRGDSTKDDLLNAFGDDVEPDFRAAVKDKATTAVNDDIASLPQVTWFRSLGYTISVRRVTTTPSGITVQPALCKVD